MTAKEYLGQVKTLHVRIERKRSELRELQAEIYSVAAVDTGREKVKASARNKGFDKVDTYIDLCEEIGAQINEFAKLKHKIIDEIHSLDNPLYETVLYKKYVEGKTLEQIAVEENYNYGYMRGVHRRALETFEKKFLKNKRDDTM